MMAEGGELPKHEAHHAVSCYMAKHGAHGLLNLHKETDPGRYDSAINSGHKRTNDQMDSLFSSKPMAPKADHSKANKALDEWIAKGGVAHDIQNEIYKQNDVPRGTDEDTVHNDMLANMVPSHNIAFQTAKGRISDYLKTLVPQKNQPKLAFDSDPDQTKQQKIYEKARNLAVHPMGVLDKIHNGTLEPEDMGHFKALHPELNDKLQRQMTEKIIEAQLAGKKPDYKTRQAMSLFMGTPLSGELSQRNIQAAQQSFQSAKASQAQESQKPQATKAKKNTAPLTKSSQSFLTGSQALAQRQQAGK